MVVDFHGFRPAFSPLIKVVIIFKIKGKYYFNDFEICILSGIAIYLWPIIPTGNVFSNWLNIIMILNIPIFIWSRKQITNN